MGLANIFGFVVIGLYFTSIWARPGQLKQQIYEFREFHSSSTQDHATSQSRDARLQAFPVHHTLWSDQHPNEVNAFAEMFRQNYNHMVAQYNEMMRMQQQTMSTMFMPVNYELYHVPVGYTWDSYFGNQQQFVNEETERMSRQLIDDIEQGRRTQQELANPNFFIEQAATELNRVHKSHEFIESTDLQTGKHFDNLQSQMQQQQQEHVHQAELEQQAGHGVVYNANTNQYEYVRLMQPHEEVADPDDTQHSSYIQSLPPVTFDNEKLNAFDQQIENIEIHTPISIETSRPVEQSKLIKTSTTKPLSSFQSNINNDEFYGSTYDQQQKFDLQFIENRSTSSRNNVMSLVRNRTIVKASTTTEIPTTTTTTTTSTTTPPPTTTTGIMSMLPHKKPPMNYEDLYQQVRVELDKHMNQLEDNKTEETHFMGMTSNREHVKLTYETVNSGKGEKEPRGDQGHPADDYIYEEPVESEPGMGYYSFGTEPTLADQTTTAAIEITTTTTSTTPRNTEPVNLNSYYSAPLAPFPTTTTTLRPLNPYYSAPLAPFPEDTVQEVSNTQQLQYAEYSEISDMNQQVQTIEHHYGSHLAEADTVQDLNNNEEFNQNQVHLMHGYIDMQQFEDEQQRYTDVGEVLNVGHVVEHPVAKPQERQLPPEQAYRNPDLQQTSANDILQEHEIPAHVQEIAVTPIPADVQNHKKNWLKRQFDKIKNVLY
ncbi:uncharacterized protein LOC134211862 [Armigeres subalbatus]|uniref:uncharacterized protein LOC134211862 n=1 Tax=Armigeres subalbatus TaxID=124917 RepID=UPI002ECFF618